MARVNVTVPDEQKEWLNDQPHLNASGLLQQAIEEQRKELHKEALWSCYSCGTVITRTDTNHPDQECPACGTDDGCETWFQFGGIIQEVVSNNTNTTGDSHD